MHLDFVDLLRAFAGAGVRSLIVGAHALPYMAGRARPAISTSGSSPRS